MKILYNSGMINFICIVAIIVEICVTVFTVIKLVEYNKKVILLSDQILTTGALVIDINNQTNSVIKKINKIVSIITDRKLWLFVTIVKKLIGFVQIFVLIRTIGFNKGFRINFRSIKKLICMELFKKTFWFFETRALYVALAVRDTAL